MLQTRLDAARNTAVCAQCHSFRDILVDNFAAGDDYYDHFLPMLEFSQPASEDPAYWPDGRPRRFSTDAYGFWQSECYLKGKATCLDCHVVPHNTDIDKNPQLKPDMNSLCTRCHAAEGTSVTAHTHHAEKSAGSSCVVYSIKAEIRDHAMTIPVPENTLHHAIPNACNVCHKNRDANWTLEKMNAWYSPASRQKLIRRADTFASARAGDPAAASKLLAMLNEPAEGPLVRANAMGYLGKYASDPTIVRAIIAALSDPEAPVRAIAARVLNPPQELRSEAAPALGAALRDPVATVRIAAAVGLIGMGLRQPPSEYVEPLELAKQLFRARAALNSDDAEQDLAAGRFYMILSDPASAIAAFQTSLKLDPQIPVQYLLGGAYAAQGNMAAAKQVLEAIPMSDSQYEKAQRLLKAIAAQETARQ
ncbi:MAG: HEAT repeat domain-containing protein [Ignavibacteriota bacterium]